ncbi:MAG TPA: GNAT family N-acetyltransferase [Streptosporangiaceae bacterium]|nr:GNAT family N-acetyltransferase [Streptosporangiaceae bacterium]
MKVERFDPGTDGASVRACHNIYLSGLPDDDPLGPPMTPRVFAGWLALGWTEDPLETWLARDDSGEPCGWYVLSLPQRENRQLAGLSLAVHAGRRRAGRGMALLRHAAGRARQAGRTVLEMDALEGSPGAAFAGTLKARPSLTAVQRVLALADLPAGRRAALRGEAEPAALGYTLLTWQGPAPGDMVDEVAVLNGAMADAPRAPGEEAQTWDAARVRLDERRVAAMGLRAHVVAARAPGPGDLAGLTQVCVDPALPDWGFQELTAVAGAHRGHRLGLLLKLAMLDLLAAREPQVARILTGNADGNQHMIAINERLGFRVLGRWPSWELDVADVPLDPAGHG